MYCPNCNQTLTPPLTGRRPTCAFCGWVQGTSEQEGGQDSVPVAHNAEEIARQRQLDTSPVWRYVWIPLGGAIVLLLGFNLVVNSFHKDRPNSRSNQTEANQSSSPDMDSAVSDAQQEPAGVPAMTAAPSMATSTPSASRNPRSSGSGQASSSPGGATHSANPLAVITATPAPTEPQPSAVSDSAVPGSAAPGSAAPGSAVPVSALPSLVPPSSALISAPPLPSPIAPSL